MTDGTLTRIRQVLLARLERKVVTTWAPALGIGAKSVRDWMDGIVCEGIAVAIAEQHKWDPAKGDFLHWAFLNAYSTLIDHSVHAKSIKDSTPNRSLCPR